MIHIHYIYRISFQSSSSYNQSLQKFGLYKHVCTSFSLFIILWPWVRVNITPIGIKMWGLVCLLSQHVWKKLVNKHLNDAYLKHILYKITQVQFSHMKTNHASLLPPPPPPPPPPPFHLKKKKEQKKKKAWTSIDQQIAAANQEVSW